MKRSLLYFFIGCLFLSSLAAMEGRLLADFPNQVLISWDRVDGAVWYDLYLDDQPIRREKSSTLVGRIGSNEEALQSNKEYQVIVAARDAKNVTLDATRFTVHTSSWAGHYYWENLTSNDNHGRCRSLHLEVRDTTDGIEMYGYFADAPEIARKLFPLLPLAQEYPEFSYHGNTEVEKAYRANAAVFNTTSIEPKTWKIEEVEVKNTFFRTKVISRVGALAFKTETVLSLEVSETGEKRVLLHNTGSGLASTGVFKSPNPGEKGVFIFKEKGSSSDIPRK